MKLIRIKLYQIEYRSRLLWYAIKRIATTGHIHFYRTVKKEGVNIYKECRCGSRKVEFSALGYSPIDVEWLSGIKE
jgi:hypothetical protein